MIEISIIILTHNPQGTLITNAFDNLRCSEIKWCSVLKATA